MLSLDDSMQSGLGVALLAFLGVALLLIQLRRHQFRSSSARDLTREQFARLRDQRGVQASMDQLLLQLEELSRRINAQADTKFLKLETVIRHADDRIARLERLLGQPTEPSEKGSPEPRAAAAIADAARNWHPTELQPEELHESTDAAQCTPQTQKPDTPLQPDVGRVHELADAGLPPTDIAKELDLPLGEVELILSLRGFR